jgi:hypothetical protein
MPAGPSSSAGRIGPTIWSVAIGAAIDRVAALVSESGWASNWIAR